MSKTCSRCGNIMEDSVQYCPQCGNYVAGFDNEQTMILNEDMKPNQDRRNQFEQSESADYRARQNYQKSAGTEYQQQYQNTSSNGYQNNGYSNTYGGNNSQNAYGVEESGLLISYKKFWKNYVKFGGRSRRSDFWWVFLINMIISVVLYGITMGTVYTAPGIATTCSVLSTIYSLACIVPIISLYVRRLHDIGKSGLFLLVIFIPIAGAIILLVWCCKNSVPGSNQWGPNPKGMN